MYLYILIIFHDIRLGNSNMIVEVAVEFKAEEQTPTQWILNAKRTEN